MVYGGALVKRGAILIAVMLAIASVAHAAPRAESAELARAKSEIATARAHLKIAREHDRAIHKREHDAARVAKLKAQLAKLECGSCKVDGPDSCLCPPATKGGK